MPPSVKMSRNARGYAEMLAARALGFLAEDIDRLGRFLALTGIDPTTLRRDAAKPGFLVSVLDYILSDEPLLLDFAADMDIDANAVANARRVLAPDVQT